MVTDPFTMWNKLSTMSLSLSLDQTRSAQKRLITLLSFIIIILQASSRGTDTETFTDNGNAVISIGFYNENIYNPLTGAETKADARLALVAINNQPSDIGGVKIGKLSTDKFYDIG